MSASDGANLHSLRQLRTLLQHVFREFLPPQWASAAGPAVASVAVYVFMAVVLAMVIAGAVTIRRALADPKPSARETLEGTYA